MPTSRVKIRNPDTGDVSTASAAGAKALKERGFEIVGEDPTHVCDVCGYEAKTAAGLGAHRRSHEDEG